jgi:quinol monooxygenase YgiN
MAFTQTMTVQADSAESLAQLMEGWHRDQNGLAPGYLGSRLLADKDRAGTYVIEVDFSSEDEARKNNERAETQAWADKLKGAAQGEPQYHNFDVAYRSG